MLPRRRTSLQREESHIERREISNVVPNMRSQEQSEEGSPPRVRRRFEREIESETLPPREEDIRTLHQRIAALEAENQALRESQEILTLKEELRILQEGRANERLQSTTQVPPASAQPKGL